MTVEELRNLLSEMPDDATVELLVQPSWPFTWDLRGVALRSALAEDLYADDPEAIAEEAAKTDVVYLVQGANQEYAGTLASAGFDNARSW